MSVFSIKKTEMDYLSLRRRGFSLKNKRPIISLSSIVFVTYMDCLSLLVVFVIQIDCFSLGRTESVNKQVKRVLRLCLIWLLKLTVVS